MNIETIEQIVALISEHPVSEITVEQDRNRVYVRKTANVGLAPSPATQVAEAAVSDANAEALPAYREGDAATEAEAIVLTAPMVGLFRHLAAPIPYGRLIAVGQTVGSIESMKLMNDVPAEHGGRVVEVLIEDGAAVEYGQPLFRLTAV